MSRSDSGIGPTLSARGQQLLGEERIPVRAFIRTRHQLRRWLLVDDRRDELAQLVAVEALEVDALGRARAFELGEHRAQRMAPVKIVTAKGADDHDASVAQIAGEEHEEIARRMVRPMQVFEHEHGRHAIAQTAEHPEQLLEQRGALAVGVVDAARATSGTKRATAACAGPMIASSVTASIAP